MVFLHSLHSTVLLKLERAREREKEGGEEGGLVTHINKICIFRSVTTVNLCYIKFMLSGIKIIINAQSHNNLMTQSVLKLSMLLVQLHTQMARKGIWHVTLHTKPGTTCQVRLWLMQLCCWYLSLLTEFHSQTDLVSFDATAPSGCSYSEYIV